MHKSTKICVQCRQPWPCEQATIDNPKRCTYRTGHGPCGQKRDWEYHGVRQPNDAGGPHRFRHDPTLQDMQP